MPTLNRNSATRHGAIIAFALGTLFFGYAFLQRVAPSVMTGELMRDFAVGGAALGSLSAFYFYAYAAIQLPVGMLTDRFGPRKLMSTAAALCALATLFFAYSDSLLTASLGRALIGATVAFAFVGTMAIAGYLFSAARYAMLAGVLQTVGMCGAIFGQAPLRQLIEVLGWRGAMGALSILALLLAVALFALVPRRPPSKRRPAEAHNGSGGSLGGLRAAACNAQTWLCASIGFGMAAPMLSFGALWAVPWLHDVHGYSTTQAAVIASTLFAGWAVCSPLLGWLSDRTGRRNPIMVLGSLLSMAAFAAIVFATPEHTALLAALMFLNGAGGSAMTVCFSSVREHNKPAYSSTALALVNMCVVGSGALMQPLIGWLLDRNWSGALLDGARVYSSDAYHFALASLLLANSAAFVGALLLRETRCRQQVA